MVPKFRAWSMVNLDYPEMKTVEGINWHGDGVWFNVLYDDETPSDWAYFSDVILMQSTGIETENGKEIYEGDIVKKTKVLLEPFEDDEDTEFVGEVRLEKS